MVRSSSVFWSEIDAFSKMPFTVKSLTLYFCVVVIYTVLPLFVTKFNDGNEIVVALGVLMTLTGEIPMLFLAKKIIDRLGYIRCLYMVCVAFALR